MRVLLDHQAFELQRWGGISRMVFELVRGLPARGVEVDLALARSLSVYAPELSRLLALPVTDGGHPESFLGGAKVPLRRQLWSIRKRLAPATLAPAVNRAFALEKLRAGGYDVFHPTYFDPYFLEALGDRPFVLTVYDLAHDVYPALFGPKDHTAARRRLLAGRATRVVAISEATKRDVVERLGVDPAKVDVVPLGFGWAAPPAPPPPLPESYLLYTGTRHAYKNWAPFVEAIAPLLLDTPGLHLVNTGHPFSASERALLARLRLQEKVLHVEASEGALPVLYARALAFVFPSLFEGFGIPVLEAFAEGCPAALARRTSLPEVGGDAALYFDPSSAEDMRSAVARLVAEPALRAELVARGRARVGTFTWDRACAGMTESYRRALEGAGAAPASPRAEGGR